MPQWEYEIVHLDAKKLLKEDERQAQMSDSLNQLGREGWELVGVAPNNVTQGLDLGGSTNAYTFIFKRPAATG